LLGGHAHKAVANEFTFEPRPPLPMKGKAEPLPVFALTGEREQRAIRLQEPSYTLPMVGRQHEIEIINSKLEMTLHNMSQIIGIVAEAGMGKSAHRRSDSLGAQRDSLGTAAPANRLGRTLPILWARLAGVL
jgi:hypothetical protein